jgi:hypothetical protein
MRTIQMSFSERNPGKQFFGYKDELNATEFVCDCTKLEQDYPGAKVKFTFLAPNKTARSLTLLLTPDAAHQVKVKLTRAETLIAGPVGIQAQAYVDDDVVTMTAIYPGDIGASVSGDATPPELTSSYVQQLDAKLVQLEQADSGLSSELAENTNLFNQAMASNESLAATMIAEGVEAANAAMLLDIMDYLIDIDAGLFTDEQSQLTNLDGGTF